MRISVIRTLAACVLLGFVSDAASHGLIQDPPSKNWLCAAITEPDQVADGTAKFPVGGNAFNFEDPLFCSLTYNDANPTANPNVMANLAAAASLSQVTSRTFAVQTQGTGNVRTTSSDIHGDVHDPRRVSRVNRNALIHCERCETGSPPTRRRCKGDATCFRHHSRN
jgi:hypothetical protein